MIQDMKANRIHSFSLTPNTLSVKHSDTSEAITGNCISAATDGKTNYHGITSSQGGEEESGKVLDCVEVGNLLSSSDSPQPLEESEFTIESSFMRNDSSGNCLFHDQRDREKTEGVMDAASPLEETNFASTKFNQEYDISGTVTISQMVVNSCKTEET